MSARTAAQALRLYTRHLASAPPPCCRGLTTALPKVAGPISPSIIYRRVRRGHSLFVTSFAGAQAGFWAYTAYLTTQVPDPLMSPAWTVAGLGLSAVFAGMANLYLKRSVAEIAIVHGSSEKVRVVTNVPGGLLSRPILIDPKEIAPGPHKDSDAERYWTFKVRDQGPLHYIVDRKSGVVDPPALAALARGGEHLAALSVRRNSTEMRERYRRWKHEESMRERAAQGPNLTTK